MTSTLIPYVLNKYKNNIFIETGTNDTSGIDVALFCKFNKIFSVELSEKLYLDAMQKYKNNKNIYLFNKNSYESLRDDILPNINESSTFWLDAHSDGHCPILLELNEIKKHYIKDHIIMIDDIRMFGKAEHEFITVKQIVNALLDINEKYNIIYERSVHGIKDILVAIN